MFRIVLVYILLAALMMGNFSQGLVYVGFEANRKEIAARLCVNRNKPMLRCNGKCYLARKLKQAEEKEKREEGQSQKSRFQEALVTDRLVLSGRFATLVTPQFSEPRFSLSQRAAAVFHPPKA